ncbi:hypothetical protein LTR85_010210 [Meristemomyces frigidus]|nr:hypothetical protein LTR85_010210 [Meristemomyces frigidus]
MPDTNIFYNSDRAFTCGVCCDDRAKGAPYVLAAGDSVCKECFLTGIKPMFLAAVKNENDYPVPWGNTVLHPKDFPEFDDQFRKEWEFKKAEYETPRAYRIYCRHRFFIDAKGHKMLVARTHADIVRAAIRRECVTGEESWFLGSLAQTRGSQIHCPRCERWSCGSCGSSRATRGERHDCRPPKGTEGVDANLGVRGLDYQICPNPACAIPTVLSDGCNTIVCRCRTHFCFICGKMAHHDSDHWTGSGCPRWNQPGTARAHNDQAGAPLIIDEIWTDRARRFRAEAAEEPEPRFKQMLLDVATCHDIVGNALARADWARANGGLGLPGVVFGDWVWPLHRLLTLNVQVQLRPKLYTLEGGRPSVFADTPDRGLQEARERVEFYNAAVAKFSEEHLAIFELYPELRPLLDRARAIFVDEVKVLEDLTAAAATEALDNLELSLET